MFISPSNQDLALLFPCRARVIHGNVINDSCVKKAERCAVWSRYIRADNARLECLRRLGEGQIMPNVLKGFRADAFHLIERFQRVEIPMLAAIGDDALRQCRSDARQQLQFQRIRPVRVNRRVKIHPHVRRIWMTQWRCRDFPPLFGDDRGAQPYSIKKAAEAEHLLLPFGKYAHVR